MNNDERTRTLQVTMHGEGKTLFQHDYRLNAGKEDESMDFHGDVTRVTARLDGGRSFEFEYNPTVDCSNAAIAMWFNIKDGTVALAYNCGSSDHG